MTYYAILGSMTGEVIGVTTDPIEVVSDDNYYEAPAEPDVTFVVITEKEFFGFVINVGGKPEPCRKDLIDRDVLKFEPVTTYESRVIGMIRWNN